jgi:hypothetical protein
VLNDSFFPTPFLQDLRLKKLKQVVFTGESGSCPGPLGAGGGGGDGGASGPQVAWRRELFPRRDDEVERPGPRWLGVGV